MMPSTVISSSSTDGANWGSGNFPTDIAFGDINGDGKDEMAVTRNATSNNRIFVYQYQGGTMRKMAQLGSQWGKETYATHVAFGDMNGDGKDELGVTRKTTVNSRVFLFTYDPSNRGVKSLTTLGGNWGKANYATAIAFGDYTGNGKDEMAIGRKAGTKGHFRFAIYSLNGTIFNEVTSGGHNWGTEYFPNDMAFGEVTGDRKAELGITRKANSNARAYIFGQQGGQHKIIKSFGNNWGSATYATSIEFGDTDGDNKDEILIGRKSGVNGRVYLYNDRSEGYDNIFTEGSNNFAGYGSLGRNVYATSVGMGDSNGDGVLEYAVGLSYTAASKARWHIFK